MENTKHDEENHIQNLSGKPAIDKLKQLAEAARICMFSTFTGKKPLPSRPLSLQSVDEHGVLHFLSAASSDKNHEIKKDPAVQLFFCNMGNSEYLSVYGTAEISTDKEKLKEHWTEMAKAWFKGGIDDPDLTLISVTPTETKYWDTKHNKAVMWLKVAVSMVSGAVMDDGVEGKLKI